MPGFLLDTNHVSEAIRPVSRVRERIDQSHRAGVRVGTCVPVLCELEVAIQSSARRLRRYLGDPRKCRYSSYRAKREHFSPCLCAVVCRLSGEKANAALDLGKLDITQAKVSDRVSGGELGDVTPANAAAYSVTLSAYEGRWFCSSEHALLQAGAGTGVRFELREQTEITSWPEAERAAERQSGRSLRSVGTRNNAGQRGSNRCSRHHLPIRVSASGRFACSFASFSAVARRSVIVRTVLSINALSAFCVLTRKADWAKRAWSWTISALDSALSVTSRRAARRSCTTKATQRPAITIRSMSVLSRKRFMALSPEMPGPRSFVRFGFGRHRTTARARIKGARVLRACTAALSVLRRFWGFVLVVRVAPIGDLGNSAE
jgi:hypothetical protein